MNEGQEWHIYDGDQWLDTVSYPETMDAEDVLNDLIDSNTYPSTIIVDQA